MENSKTHTLINNRSLTPSKNLYSKMIKSQIRNIQYFDQIQGVQQIQKMQRVNKIERIHTMSRSPYKSNNRCSYYNDLDNINNSNITNKNHLNITSNTKTRQKNQSEIELRLQTLEKQYLKLLNHAEKKISLQKDYQQQIQKLKKRRQKDQRQLNRLNTMKKYLSYQNICTQTNFQLKQQQTSQCHAKCQKSTNLDSNNNDENWKNQNKIFQKQNIVAPIKKSRIHNNKIKSQIMQNRKSAHKKLKFVPSVAI